MTEAEQHLHQIWTEQGVSLERQNELVCQVEEKAKSRAVQDAVRLYEAAYDDIQRAAESVRKAHAMAAQCHPGTNNYCYSQADEIKAFRQAVCLPEREGYLCTARRLTELGAWAWIVERTYLERLMDMQAKNQPRNQMQYVPE